MKLEYFVLIVAIAVSSFAIFNVSDKIKYAVDNQICQNNLREINFAVKMYNFKNSPQNYFEQFNKLNQQILIAQGFLDKPLDCPGGGIYFIKNNKVICSLYSK